MIGRREELVAAWVEGDLDGREAQAAEVEVSASPALMVVAARMRSARERLVRHGPVAAPPALLERVEAGIDLPRRTPRRERRWLAAASAAGLLAAGLITGLWLASDAPPETAVPLAAVEGAVPPAWRLVTTAATEVVRREVEAAGAVWGEADGAVALTLAAARGAEVERRLAALGTLEAVGAPRVLDGDVRVELRVEAPAEADGP